MKNMLTRLTPHGLTARLACHLNLQDGLGLRCVFVTSTIPGTPMPNIPPWATNSLPQGHLHSHQSLPFDGSALSTVIPVVLIVLPIIKASRGSLILMLRIMSNSHPGQASGWTHGFRAGGGRGGGSEEEVEGGGDGGGVSTSEFHTTPFLTELL